METFGCRVPPNGYGKYLFGPVEAVKKTSGDQRDPQVPELNCNPPNVHPRYSVQCMPVVLESNDKIHFHVDLVRLALESTFFRDLSHLPSDTCDGCLCRCRSNNIIPLPFSGAAITFMLDATPISNLPSRTPKIAPITKTIIDDILDISDSYHMEKLADRLLSRLQRDNADTLLINVVAALTQQHDPEIQRDIAIIFFQACAEDDWARSHLYAHSTLTKPSFKALMHSFKGFCASLEEWNNSRFGKRCMNRPRSRGKCPEAVRFEGDFVAFRRHCMPAAWIALVEINETSVQDIDPFYLLGPKIDQLCFIKCPICRNRLIDEVYEFGILP